MRGTLKRINAWLRQSVFNGFAIVKSVRQGANMARSKIRVILARVGVVCTKGHRFPLCVSLRSMLAALPAAIGV